jgi:DNA replication protein DnaC
MGELIQLIKKHHYGKVELTKEKCSHCGSFLKNKTTFLPGLNRTIIAPLKCECLIKKEIEKKVLEVEYNKKRRLTNLFKQSKLGERFIESNFDKIIINNNNKLVVSNIKSFAENFIENKDKSFLIYSHSGTGKTLMASAVANYLIKKYKSAIFCKVPELLGQITNSYNNGEVTEQKILNGLRECDLLILDDLGAESHKYSGDWASQKIYQIIDSRYTDKKSIIFTTNFDLYQLRTMIGDRSFSRIIEMTKNNVFSLEAEKDWRLD